MQLSDLVKDHQASINDLLSSLGFLLAEVLIFVCQNVTTDQFPVFSDSLDAYCSTPVQAGSIEEKLRKLLTDGYLSVDEVESLRGVLEVMGKTTLVAKVNQFMKKREELKKQIEQDLEDGQRFPNSG